VVATATISAARLVARYQDELTTIEGRYRAARYNGGTFVGLNSTQP